MRLWGFERFGWSVVERRDWSGLLMADLEVRELAVWERHKDIEQRDCGSELRRECSAWPSAAGAGRGPGAAVNDSSVWRARERAHEVSILKAYTGAVGG